MYDDINFNENLLKKTQSLVIAAAVDLKKKNYR